MAQMIPNFIDQEDPRLCGERRVFMWLSDDAVPGFVLHSLLQKNHRNKMIGEVDFLYISSKGILCIEVKGGKEIYRKSGEWYSVNKLNVHNKIKDPFRQAKDCMYALKNYLIETYGYMSQEAKCLLGYAVIFPECKFTGHGNDLVTEVMFDCKWNLDQFPHFLNNVFDFWKRQTKEKQQYDPPMLTNEQVNKYINLLRGDFKVVPSMNLELQYIDKQIIELTEEQFDALDFTLENKRVVIQGGAGTGKSLLAIEKVRKTIAKNKSVLYICFNKNMAKYAQHALEDCIPNNCFVGTYHSLIQKTLKQTDLHELNIKEISNMFLSNKPETFQYDCLIVDEAQDLMNICVLEVINNFLKDGMEKGEWVLFLDPNQNIFNHTDEYDFAWEYIKSVYTPTIVPLSKNCRNTEQIGRKTSSLTLVPPAKHMKISGPKVITKAYDT
ncbi:MAG: DUF2075 domain-containing protein, partial [Ruminococcaceae bacterium]|nr:DUF2075 domain-containing protein [Oscillospiraceae bacterium]